MANDNRDVIFIMRDYANVQETPRLQASVTLHKAIERKTTKTNQTKHGMKYSNRDGGEDKNI